MDPRQNQPPIVLVFAGHDPTSGAGLVADALTLSALACHPITICTALTAQDSQDVSELQPVDPDFIQRQLTLLLEDVRISAIKTGLLASVSIVELISQLADQLAVPLIVDPVLASGAGTKLAPSDLISAYREKLLPNTFLATPNQAEARQLSDNPRIDEAAQAMLANGCQHLLITGTDNHDDASIDHYYYSASQSHRRSFNSQRLEGSFHGSGCTLAAAICAAISHGAEVEQAITDGLAYTARTLDQAYSIGNGQPIPRHRVD